MDLPLHAMRPDMRGQTRAKLPMTSLIDVIFLLLLFFMLTSTFSRFGEIPVTVGGTGASVVAGDVPPILVRISQNGPSINGVDTPASDLRQAVLDISDDVPRLLVTATSEASAQALAETLHALRSVSGAQIVVLK